MRLTRIELEGFGKSEHFRENLGTGMHVFFGPNESGKSTIQQGILALLYGFYSGDRARPSENAARERFVPWIAARYDGSLHYELADGTRFRVQRDFGSDEVPTTLRDMTTGQDVTDTFGRGRHGNVPFARRQLGMSKEVFDACAFISHGEVPDLAGIPASPQEIGDAVVALADSARRDVSAQSAINRLEDVLRERVGGPRSRTTPLPVARGSLHQALAEMQEIERVRAELATDAERLDEVSAEVERLRADIHRTHYHVLTAQTSDLDERIERLEVLERTDADLRQQRQEHQEFAHFPVEERDGVHRRLQTIVDLRKRCEDVEADVGGARTALDERSRERGAAAMRAAELSYIRDFPAELNPEIEDGAASWEEARTLHDSAERRLADTSIPEQAGEEFARLQAEVGDLSSEHMERLAQRLRAPAPGGLASVLKAILGPIAALLRAIARLLGLLSGGRRRASRGAGEGSASAGEVRNHESLGPDEIQALLSRHRRYLELRPAIERRRDAERAAEDATARREDAGARLRTLIDGLVNEDELHDLSRALQTVRDRADRRRELDEVQERLELLDRERQSLQDRVTSFDRDVERRQELERQLERELREWTGADDQLEILVEAFDEGCSRQSTFQRAGRGLAENEENRASILQGRSRAELKTTRERLADQTKRLLADVPSLAGARSDEPRDSLEQRLAQLQGKLRDGETRSQELRTRIETRFEELRPRAEVEEEKERYQREVAKLERFRDELGVALEIMNEAMTQAHRDFAPAVGNFLSQRFEAITGGRYTRVLLDPSTLRLTTTVPETGDLEDVELLSRGTRAVAYLLLRIGLAQHMSTMGEPVPIILDDSLVDLDGERLRNCLNILLELTSQMQLLLFTKDESVEEWFEQACAGTPGHSLTRLSLSAVASGNDAGDAGDPAGAT